MRTLETLNGNLLADRAFERYNAIKRMAFDRENASLTGNPVVFFGDSITDFCDLKKYYPDVYAVNRGIAGNTVSDLIHRIEGSLFHARPSKVVLLIGTNDILNTDKTIGQIAELYEELLKRIREGCPNVPVIVQSVYPGFDTPHFEFHSNYHDREDLIVELNKRIEGLASEYGHAYVDVYSALLEHGTKSMDRSYSFDGCHPNDAGYLVIAREVRPYL